MRHKQPRNLTRSLVLVDSQELPDANRQGETLAARSVQQASVQLTLVQGQHWARGQTKPADRHAQCLCVKSREIGE